MTARIYSSASIHKEALKIDIFILYQVISGTLIDGGSGINIMLLIYIMHNISSIFIKIIFFLIMSSDDANFLFKIGAQTTRD